MPGLDAPVNNAIGQSFRMRSATNLETIEVWINADRRHHLLLHGHRGVVVLPNVVGLVNERVGMESIGWVIACGALVVVGLHERLVAITDRPDRIEPSSRR